MHRKISYMHSSPPKSKIWMVYPAKFYGVVLRGSGGEENHMVYISNSTIEASKYTFRMSNYSSRVYIGAGNGFDATSASIPANCIITDEIYAN